MKTCEGCNQPICDMCSGHLNMPAPFSSPGCAFIRNKSGKVIKLRGLVFCFGHKKVTEKDELERLTQD